MPESSRLAPLGKTCHRCKQEITSGRSSAAYVGDRLERFHPSCHPSRPNPGPRS